MTEIAPTIRFDIFMAGDIAQAKQVCREYCFEVGLCVSVEPVTYIYTGGEESGFRVGLINYPRFPTTEDALHWRVCELAHRLMVGLCQHSYSIVGPHKTEWFSRRPEASPLTSHQLRTPPASAARDFSGVVPAKTLEPEPDAGGLSQHRQEGQP